MLTGHARFRISCAFLVHCPTFLFCLSLQPTPSPDEADLGFDERDIDHESATQDGTMLLVFPGASPPSTKDSAILLSGNAFIGF